MAITLFLSTPMTDDQIEQAVANYRKILKKHADGFDTQAVEVALGRPELAREQFATFRRQVESVSKLFVRKVKVDPGRSSQEALEAAGCYQSLEPDLMRLIPRETEGEVGIVFFKPGPLDSEEELSGDLEREFASRGLRPVDPVSLAAANEEDPFLAVFTPHGTYWVDPTGIWCFVAFYLTDNERASCICAFIDAWDPDWWCAGVPV